MSEAKHTPEPWAFDNQYRTLKDCEGHEIYLDGGRHPTNRYPLAEANSARIVACVNACAGISTEQLEAGCVERALKSLDALVAKRDRPHGFRDPDWYEREFEEARTALALLEKDTDK